MNELLSGLMRGVLRVAMMLAGLVVLASLVAAALLLAALWALRALWARLRGQPVTPLVWQLNPQARWGGAMRRAQQAYRGEREEASPHGPSWARRGGVLPSATEVTDVEPRERP